MTCLPSRFLLYRTDRFPIQEEQAYTAGLPLNVWPLIKSCLFLPYTQSLIGMTSWEIKSRKFCGKIKASDGQHKTHQRNAAASLFNLAIYCVLLRQLVYNKPTTNTPGTSYISELYIALYIEQLCWTGVILIESNSLGKIPTANPPPTSASGMPGWVYHWYM